MQEETKESLQQQLDQLEREYGRRFKRGDSEVMLQHYRDAINATAKTLKRNDSG